MAKGLKIGDIVTVRKKQPVPKDEAAYQAGLTMVMPGQRGRIVKAANGRGFIIEFDSHELVLSAQALDILPDPPAKVVPIKVAKSGKKAAAKVVTVKPQTTSAAVSDTNSSVIADMVSTSNAAQDVASIRHAIQRCRVNSIRDESVAEISDTLMKWQTVA